MPDNLEPLDSAANRSKPAAGVVCPNQKCGAVVCGRLTPAAKAALKKRHPGRKPKNVAYTRYRRGTIQRVRVCPICGRRFLTSEGIVSNGTGGNL
jgi:hypothetical protein